MTTFPLTRRTILAGAAMAGALSQVRAGAAQAQEVLTPVSATSADSLPRVKVKLVDPLALVAAEALNLHDHAPHSSGSVVG